jgi:hypothetical protein
MSRLECKRRNGYLVCYPRRRHKTESIIGGILLSLGVVVAVIMVISLFTSNQAFWVPQSTSEATSQPQMPETENEVSKLQAVEYLNRIRGEEGIPPVQLIDLSVARFKAEYLARTNLFSHYDSEGRHPGYWYTRLDGGLYGVEENLFVVYTVGSGRPSARIAKINYSDAIYNLVFDDALSMWGHRDSLLDPCHNYVAMATSYFRNSTYVARYYVVYMVAKWVEWISPPHYEGGRFTAEGYATPEMKPEVFAVYYASYESNPASRHSYNVGDLYLCKYLDPPSLAKVCKRPRACLP